MNEPLATPQQATSVARGEAFRTTDSAFLSSEGIIQHFSTARSEQDYLQRAAELDGSWHYISNTHPAPSHDIFAFVDHRSTLSLYYRIEGSEIRFSDNGFDLIHPDETQIETPPATLLFFSQWGFTPEDSTLHPDIKRIPVGCGIHFSPSTREVTTLRYDTSLYEGSRLEGIEYEEAKRLFRERLSCAMDRMAQRLANHPVLLPLTAGRDSRLIALALKERGVSSVSTCTYGASEGIHEVQRARTIAQKLGFPHHFISTLPTGYDKRGYTQDAEAIKYLNQISGLGSGYFFAEYTTAQQMAQRYPGAVVLPGHNGDIIGGDNLHLRFVEGATRLETNAYLMCFHENGNRRLERNEVAQLADLHQVLLTSYPQDKTAIELFETFRNRELMPKYYINSSRSWRYFGLSVWMPFLDKDLCQFMHSLPAPYRIGKRLYEEVSTELFREAGISFANDFSAYQQWQKPAFRVKQLLRPFFVYQHSRRRRPLFPKGDLMGFRQLMAGDLLKEVQHKVPWYPTTINGLSFAWWLQYNNCLPKD